MQEETGLFNDSAAEAPPSASAVPDEGQEKPAKLVYGSAEEFLHEQLLPTYVRDIDGRALTWCAQWYFHPEAIDRIESLWRAWENLRLDAATGLSIWYKDHADHHMAILMNPRGPFYQCDKHTHREPQMLELEKAPPGWFVDDRIDQP